MSAFLIQLLEYLEFLQCENDSLLTLVLMWVNQLKKFCFVSSVLQRGSHLKEMVMHVVKISIIILWNFL